MGSSVSHTETLRCLLWASLFAVWSRGESNAAWREQNITQKSHVTSLRPPGRRRPSRQHTPTSAAVTSRSHTAQRFARKSHTHPSRWAALFRISEPIGFWWKQKLTVAPRTLAAAADSWWCFHTGGFSQTRGRFYIERRTWNSTAELLNYRFFLQI